MTTGNDLTKDDFFQEEERVGLRLTYDDVLLQTGFASVMPEQVSLETKFSRNVGLKMPLVSAAMDRVTEYKLAIAIAKLGGIGVIHRNLSPREQARHVARVKYYLNGRVLDKPICVREHETIESILKMRDEKQYHFQSFPVINAEGMLVGLLTGNDFEFCDNLSLVAQDVMTPVQELIKAREWMTLEAAYELMKKHKKKVLPLVDQYGRVAGLYVFSDLKRIKSGDASLMNVDEHGRLRVAAAVGTGEEAIERTHLLVAEKVDVVVIDTAHADSVPVYETLRELKLSFLLLDVVVGNISEAASARRLAEAGAAGIKVGQGPSSICTTRIVAGAGGPQLSAVYHCSRAVEEFDIPVCADGGIRYSGDIPKAIGAGAHSVMIGKLFAGTKEAPGEIVFRKGAQWKEYRGMGSLGAMEHRGSRERYGITSTEKGKMVPEGIEGLEPYKGELKGVVAQLVGGLRAGMGYAGAANIEELRTKTKFIRVTQAGKVESHPHDIEIMKEAPNYSSRLSEDEEA